MLTKFSEDLNANTMRIQTHASLQKDCGTLNHKKTDRFLIAIGKGEMKLLYLEGKTHANSMFMYRKHLLYNLGGDPGGEIMRIRIGKTSHSKKMMCDLTLTEKMRRTFLAST
jgi:hypothetical protein